MNAMDKMLRAFQKMFEEEKKPEIWFSGNENFKRQRTSVDGDWFAYRYWCPDCNEELSAGPRGGASVNVVCHKCKINWGCLPDFYDV